MSDQIPRTLPHNLDAERAVLGAILIRNEAINAATVLIDSADFFRAAHRIVFDRMVALSQRGQAIDFVTLVEELDRTGQVEEVGGAAYVAALTDGVPRATNVEHYARIVKEKSTRRRLIVSANQILTDAYSSEDEADQQLDAAQRQIFEISDDAVRSGFVPLSAVVRDGFATLEALQGRPYVRWLLGRGVATREPGRPADFAEHATFFSRAPERLAETPFARALPPASGDDGDDVGAGPDGAQGLAALTARLGPQRPVLVRDLTPPLVAQDRAWRVVRVAVPGLQPMHGNHALPLLGGPLWAPRGLADWANVPPHPFP